jgi:hypothetical protein
VKEGVFLIFAKEGEVLKYVFMPAQSYALPAELSLRNTITGEFFNGFKWQKEEAGLSMKRDISGGFFYFELKSLKKGFYEATVKHFENKLVERTAFEITNSDIIGFTNEAVIVSKDHTPGQIITAKVQRSSDGYFYKSGVWTPASSQNPASEVAGIYSISVDMESPDDLIVTFHQETNLIGTKRVSVRDYDGQSLQPDTGVTFSWLSVDFGYQVLGTTSAEVKTAEGGPMSGVDVTAFNKATERYYSTSTDKDGYWALKVPTGEYIIVFSGSGYVSESFEWEVL